MCIINPKYNHEYIIIRWNSLSYTIEEVQEKRGISIGDLVVTTTKINPIASDVSWFTIGNVKTLSN